MTTPRIELDPYDPARVQAIMLEARRMRNAALADLVRATLRGRWLRRLVGQPADRQGLPGGAAPQA